jgi:hypothetical protein
MVNGCVVNAMFAGGRVAEAPRAPVPVIVIVGADHANAGWLGGV